ncbi:RICIN domain-containing protein [Mixta mediterraneensis]|uniref:RICIN domain-containing protein n=1 Tax=Mixta mediterraneensis TaxID=2758443 RepID=UPI001873AA05|nr:RICIN domain-containing protein [Mixta mediterraneensis]MBE5254253.1 hypothetical protein [Mixta mediterraneensis]
MSRKFVSENVIYRIIHAIDNKRLDAEGDGDSVYITHKKEDDSENEYQFFYFQEVSDGCYNIIHKKSGYALDAPSSGDSIYLSPFGHDNQYERWTIVDGMSENTVKFIHNESGYVLDGRDDFIYLLEDNGSAHQEWIIQPIIQEWESSESSVTLGEDLSNVSFEQKTKSASESVFQKASIHNKTDATVEETIRFLDKVEQSNTVIFRETLRAGASIKFEFAIPGFGSAGTETHYEIELGSEQSKTETHSRELTIERTIHVPPRTNILATGVVLFVKDHETDMLVDFWLKAKFLTKHGRNEYVSSEELEKQLEISGFKGEIKSKGDKKIHVSIPGKIKCTLGLDTKLVLENLVSY